MKPQAQVPSFAASTQGYSVLIVRYLIAPLLTIFSGFHTMDFILGGMYTWPQMSRVMALTLAVAILSYEFVYKEDREQTFARDSRVSQQGMKNVLYSCLVLYLVGAFALLSLVIFSK